MKICPACRNNFEDSSSFCPNDGEILEIDLVSILGTTLDEQYHIEALLGQGGMGTVYRARHTLLGDRVAVKILPSHLRGNPEYLRRFLREGQAARRFRHPNAVTVYDLRTASDGLAYMVLEYVEGHTLRAELEKRGRLSPAEALELLEPVACALNAAHTMGVVHRDLKPENIMIGKSVDGKPIVKLLDLGIAKIHKLSEIATQTPLTHTGQILGTPYYMSPEQWGITPEDEGPEIDGRADIYSLGVIFYELIAGRRPFEGKTLQELACEHLAYKPPALHETFAEVPEAFGLAVSRAMAKERSKRQATCGELIAELHASMQVNAKSEMASGATAATMQVLSSTRSANIASDHALTQSRSIVLAALVVALILSIGWFGWKQIRVKTNVENKVNPSANTASSETEEAVRYWLEIAPPAPGGLSIRKVGAVSLASDQEFKFHFTTREYGYLYIIGAGKENALTTFLTAQPAPQSGLKTNAIRAGEDYIFPYGDERWIMLDSSIGTEKYTIIFSPTPIRSPAFLSLPSGHNLTAEENRELKALRAQASAQLVIFDISIEHR